MNEKITFIDYGLEDERPKMFYVIFAIDALPSRKLTYRAEYEQCIMHQGDRIVKVYDIVNNDPREMTDKEREAFVREHFKDSIQEESDYQTAVERAEYLEER